jgi:hypothetical protein
MTIWYVVKSQRQRDGAKGMHAAYRTLDKAVKRATKLAKKLKRRMYVVIFTP